MSQFRLVAALLVMTAAGCYREASAPSTFPDPSYVSGPPGGAMDPDPAYNAYAQAPADEAAALPVADDAPAPPPQPPSEIGDGDDEAAPAAPAAPADDLVETAPPATDPGPLAEAPPAPDPAADPTAGVTDVEIDATLDGYGQWIDSDDYGQVWRPDATVVGVDFTPYESGGSWQQTDTGWGFSCDYPWGWLPFHYGRWAWFDGYWGWVPGHRWAPAWVEWRHGGGVVGWRPLAPNGRERGLGGHRFGRGPEVRDHRHAQQRDAHWRFAAVSDFNRPHIRSHLYGNLAEGLRTTAPVAAPPLRARNTVRTVDLMRDRFAAGRATQPGYRGTRDVRDHRPAYGPGTNPAIGTPPVRTYQQPRAYQPYQQPRAYQQYQQPRAYQPYQQPRAYQPYQQPRAYQPYQQPRAYQPYQQPRAYQPPPRASQPSVRTYQAPPRSYQPPPRSAPPPSRSWTPAPSSGGSRGGGSSSHSGGSSSHSGGGSSHSSGGGSSHSSGGGGHHR